MRRVSLGLIVTSILLAACSGSSDVTSDTTGSVAGVVSDADMEQRLQRVVQCLADDGWKTEYAFNPERVFVGFVAVGGVGVDSLDNLEPNSPESARFGEDVNSCMDEWVPSDVLAAWEATKLDRNEVDEMKLAVRECLEEETGLPLPDGFDPENPGDYENRQALNGCINEFVGSRLNQ